MRSSMRHFLPVFAIALVSFAALASEVKQGPMGKNVQAVRFQSESLGTERAANVLLPLDYETSTNRYPVLYLLHGLGDDQMAWPLMTNVSAYAAKHRVIVVMPDGGRSWYVNSAADPKEKFDDFIAKDLIAYVDSHYRTIPLRRARAVAGLSMGGYGAAMLGLKHYQKFTALATFSGAVGFAVDRKPDPNANEASRRLMSQIEAMFGPQGSDERRGKDPFTLLLKVPPAQMPGIYVSCGGQDFLIAQNREFVALMAQNKIPYEYREFSPAVHSWDVWDHEIRTFLDILDKRDGWSAE
jgi:putative tributyrin esterase